MSGSSGDGRALLAPRPVEETARPQAGLVGDRLQVGGEVLEPAAQAGDAWDRVGVRSQACEDLDQVVCGQGGI